MWVLTERSHFETHVSKTFRLSLSPRPRDFIIGLFNQLATLSRELSALAGGGLDAVFFAFGLC